jgi:FtsH-binding integral membrane protein
MKTKQDPEFSWNMLFIVTAISFLAFSGFIKLIDGSPEHAGFFLKIGVASLVLFIVSLIAGSEAKTS